jgi:hypothetical protein
MTTSDFHSTNFPNRRCGVLVENVLRQRFIRRWLDVRRSTFELSVRSSNAKMQRPTSNVELPTLNERQ